MALFLNTWLYNLTIASFCTIQNTRALPLNKLSNIKNNNWLLEKRQLWRMFMDLSLWALHASQNMWPLISIFPRVSFQMLFKWIKYSHLLLSHGCRHVWHIYTNKRHWIFVGLMNKESITRLSLVIHNHLFNSFHWYNFFIGYMVVYDRESLLWPH